MSDKQIDRIRNQFTRTADIYARMRQTTDERALDALVGLAQTEATDSCLDVACGPGFLTLALARKSAQTIGFDATDAFLELARKTAKERNQDNVRFEQGDAEALPFADDHFDVVTCRAAFHHFPRPERVLAEMARVMAPAGRILIADLTGSEDPETAELHDRIEKLCDPTHERALPLCDFEDLFRDCGLRVVHKVKSKLDYELEEWLAHGSPTSEAAREVGRLMESNLEIDQTGLNLRRQDGKIHFSHQTAAYVLAGAGPS